MRFYEDDYQRYIKYITFNSLYEILKFIIWLKISLIGCFQFSLWDSVSLFSFLISSSVSLSILFMRFLPIITFSCSSKNNFQFSLWDSKWQFLLSVLAVTLFQFSLWDSHLYILYNHKEVIAFQFSLWDSVLLIAIKVELSMLTFNSLYEILMTLEYSL